MPSSLVVAAIGLNRAFLQGTLVKELSLLHLNSNRFSRTVLYSFKDLIKLLELDLSNNQFFEPFPTLTLLIPNLIYLNLRYNHLSGPIPPGLLSEPPDAIFLDSNMFDGEIPDNLSNSQASVITLASNKLTGEIPTSFRYMGPSLKEIIFFNNQLTGSIPQGVGFLTEMEVFDVSYNKLTRQLSDSISCLEKVKILNLAHHKLSGEVSEIICSLWGLVNLTVSFSFFYRFSRECFTVFTQRGV